MPLFYSPEVINIQRRQDELNNIIPRVNNFHIKKRHGIFVLLYATKTKNDLGRKKLTKHSKFFIVKTELQQRIKLQLLIIDP